MHFDVRNIHIFYVSGTWFGFRKTIGIQEKITDSATTITNTDIADTLLLFFG